MKSYHVTLDGQLYRLSQEAMGRFLKDWKRLGKPPRLFGRLGVEALGIVSAIDNWTADDVRCECGCGLAVTIADENRRKWGHKKGQPVRFVSGHNCRSGGRKHPAWQGGRVKNHVGYTGLKCPGHPQVDANGYVPEQVLVAEKAMQREIPPAAVVHHVNKKRNDNANQNLVVCEDHRYHMLLHQRQRALAQCGRAGWLPCPFCKKYDSPSNLYIYQTRNGGYHRTCASRDMRMRRKQGEFAEFTGEVVASSLTQRQAERMLQEGVK